MSSQDVAPPGWFAMPDGTTMYWNGAEWRSADPLGNTSPPQPKVWRAPSRKQMGRAILVGAVLGTLLGVVVAGGARFSWSWPALSFVSPFWGTTPLWAFALAALLGAVLGASTEYYRYGRRRGLSILAWAVFAGLMLAGFIYMWPAMDWSYGDTTIAQAAERYRWGNLVWALMPGYMAATIVAGWHNLTARRPSKAERRGMASPGGTASLEASGGAA